MKDQKLDRTHTDPMERYFENEFIELHTVHGITHKVKIPRKPLIFEGENKNEKDR